MKKEGMKENEDKKDKPLFASKDFKHIIIFLLIILVIAGFFFAIKYYQSTKIFTNPDAMHEANLDGELPPDLGYIYNGFSFIKIDENTWLTKILVPNIEGGVINLQLRYGPKDLEDVKIIGDPDYITRFNASYITFDPTHENLTGIALAAADLTSNLIKTLNIVPVSACTNNRSKACAIKDIVSCETHPEYPIYYLREAKETAIIAEGNCLTIQGPYLDIVKAVDRLVLKWYNVMP